MESVTTDDEPGRGSKRPSDVPWVREWLKDRPTDRRGLPVPVINRWGAETAAATRVGFDGVVGRQALFHDDHGPVPDFLRQSPQRQRWCMVEGRCQVCGRFVPWSRRWVPVFPESVDFVTVHGRTRVPVVFEPWLDERCALIAARWCPALIRRGRQGQLRMHAVTSVRDCVSTVSLGSVDGWPETLTRPVAMFVKQALLTLDIRQEAAGTHGEDETL